MKKIISLTLAGCLAIATALTTYAARVAYQGNIVTATTSTNKYQIGSTRADFVTEVSINVTGSEVVWFIPNVETNAVTTAIPVRAGFPYTFEGDNIFFLSYYTTNGTAAFDIGAEGY